jgi:lipoate-protein ligase B
MIPVCDESAMTTDNGQRTTDPKKAWIFADLGILDYQQAWQLQADLVAARRDGRIDANMILTLEHPSVFTLGRRGGLEYLLVSEDCLKRSGIPVVQVERGGFITYHGPGQLVLYPIIDLEAERFKVVDLVDALEEIMIRTAADWGVAAGRNPANRGVWVGLKKLGSIGIAVRRGVSFHGMALNVNLDLTSFSWIQPCGLSGVAMTSMHQESSRQIPMEKVRRTVRSHVESVFDARLTDCRLSDLQRFLRDAADRVENRD